MLNEPELARVLAAKANMAAKVLKAPDPTGLRLSYPGLPGSHFNSDTVTADQSIYVVYLQKGKIEYDTAIGVFLHGDDKSVGASLKSSALMIHLQNHEFRAHRRPIGVFACYGVSPQMPQPLAKRLPSRNDAAQYLSPVQQEEPS